MEQQMRRRVRPKRKGLRWDRIIVALLGVVLIIGGLVWGIQKAVEDLSNPSETTESGPKLPPVTTTVPVDMKSIKTSYMLVVGVDKSQMQQADALYLVAFNLDAKTMQVIGIPSNSKIINRHNDTPQRLNDMYGQGGIELTKAVVEDMFHIVIPHYAIVDQDSFQSMMHIFGTPSLYVENSMVHQDMTTGQVDINIHQGFQDFTDETAFGYMRFVDGDGNTLSRTMHQERLLKAMLDREKNHVSLGTAFRVWRLWSHISTNISTWDGVRLMTKLIEFPKDKIRWYILQGTPETIQGVSYWNVEPTDLQQLIGITVGDIPSDEKLIPVIGDGPKETDTKKTETPKESTDSKEESTEPGSPTTR